VTDSRIRYEEALQRGNSYTWDQRWPEAIREFRAALNEAPHEAAPYAGLGMAFFEMGELEKSLEAYKLAARHSNGDIVYLRQVADVQERLGQLREAGQTYMAVGEIQLRRRRVDDAVANWLLAVRLEPNLVGAHQRLASLYQRQGLNRSAIREYLALARIFQMRGEKDRALAMCQAALNLDPRSPDVLTAMELVQHGEQLLADEEEATPISSAAGELSVPAAVQRVAAVLEGERQASGAASGEEVSNSPADTARRLAQEQLAREIFEEEDEGQNGAGRVGISKLEQDALISQALDFENRGMLDEAIACYERGIAGGVTSRAARFNLGLLYQERSRVSQAIRELEVTQRDPNFGLASHYALGQLYRMRNQVDKSVMHFMAALRLIDLQTVQPEHARRVAEQYDHLISFFLNSDDSETALDLTDALVRFLGRPGWQHYVRQARERLDRLSTGNRTLILGDILSAGSTQVLESLYLSQEHAEKGQYDTAVEEVFRAIQLSPYYLPGHLQLAELMGLQNRLDGAVAKFVTIGDTYAMRGDVSASAACYQRALELAPMNVATRSRLIGLLLDHDQAEKALEHYLIQGDAFYRLAEFDRARETYLEALKLAPAGSQDKAWRAPLLLRIADIDMQRLDWRRALAAYAELATADPTDERVMATLVDLYFKVGQPENAFRQLDYFLVSLVRGGKVGRIGPILEEMVEQRPGEASLVDRLVRLYMQQGRRRDAEAALQQLGRLQLEAGDRQAAQVTRDRLASIQASPTNGDAERPRPLRDD
jgi:tetratricopeptide (TPR) repeat protein